MTTMIDRTSPDALQGVEWCIRAGINWRLLQAELEFVTAHPEQHDQTTWARRTDCGTACCLAGWTVIHAGFDLAWVRSSDEGVVALWLATHDITIREQAIILLGLSDDDAHRLFNQDNTLADLWQIGYAITRGAVRRP